jgi:hypothetical protein
MKKQLVILIVAFIAISLTSAYAQVTAPSPRVVDITCLPSDALHPMAGTPYTYEVNVPTPAGTKEYTWFVTQDKNFITAGALTANRQTTAGSFLAVTGAGYNNPATGGTTLSLTWKSFVYDPLNPVFVVIQVKSTVAGECSPNNLKVFKIQPVNAFTLDVANVGADKTTVSPYSVTINRCLSDMVSSFYDVTDDQVKTDYGVDYLYFVVTAANYTTSWRPSVQLSGIAAGETVTAVEWFRPTDATFATPEAMPLSGTEYIATNPVLVLDPTGTVGAAGEGIVIRVTIDHTDAANIYEGLTDETITLAVDGKTMLSSPTPLGDVHFSSTVPVANAFCGLEDGYQFDMATQVLKARPDVQAVAPSAPFLPIKP